MHTIRYYTTTNRQNSQNHNCHDNLTLKRILNFISFAFPFSKLFIHIFFVLPVSLKEHKWWCSAMRAQRDYCYCCLTDFDAWIVWSYAAVWFCFWTTSYPFHHQRPHALNIYQIIYWITLDLCSVFSVF